jgi:hypothetical protein
MLRDLMAVIFAAAALSAMAPKAMTQDIASPSIGELERQLQAQKATAVPHQSFGSIAITSDPSGAEISLDGVQRGVTPLTLHKVHAATVISIHAELSGYIPKDIQVEVEEGQSVPVHIELTLTGRKSAQASLPPQSSPPVQSTQGSVSECEMPRPPERIPDGSSASKEEMIASMRAFRFYNDGVKAYTDCLSSKFNEVIANSTDSHAINALQLEHARRNDAAVDAAQEVTARFNEQIKVYNDTHH